MSRSLLIILVFLSIQACIDPLEVRLPVYQRQMVVDGGVYEGPGPHQVKLYYSANLESSSEFRNPEPISNAQVRIISSDGAIVNLQQSSAGVYETQVDELVAEVGQFYHLEIQHQQRSYQSIPQKLEASGTIDNLYFEFERNYLKDSRTGLFQNALLVYIDAQADAESEGLIRWRYTGTYEIITQPELVTVAIPTGSLPPLRVPNPLPCSGYIASGNTIARVDDCTCCTCWVSEDDGLVKLAKNRFVQNKAFNKVLIAIIPVDTWRFYKKYVIEVEQLSISEEVYEFWKRVEAQQQGAASLFQPNAVIINGNIQNMANPQDRVLGIFNVSAVHKKMLHIHRSDLPVTLGNSPQLTDDCRNFNQNSSNQRPLFW
jgi:hypothetical protein